jgi:hypothetical protein
MLYVDRGQITEAVSATVWTAAPGSEIGAGQFQKFDISAGPLPDVNQIIFKALQYYSDGDIVRWIDEPTPGVAEPEHPAPIVELSPAAGAATSDSENGVARAALGLGIASVVLGLAGLALASSRTGG